MTATVELYYWSIPHGWKITILLEELDEAYRLRSVNDLLDGQYTADYIRFLPDNRTPVMVDRNPLDGGKPMVLFESGTILQYLAEKHGRFLPRDRRAKFNTLQWVYWQPGEELSQLYCVLDNCLKDMNFLSGDYSIADMALWPYIAFHRQQGLNLTDYPHLQRWYERLRVRPAVARGYAVAKIPEV